MNSRAQTEESVEQIAKTEWTQMHKEKGENAQRICAQIHKEGVHKCTKRLNQQ